MSKTETQSEALKLAETLEIYGHRGTQKAAAELRGLDAENKALRADAERYHWLRRNVGVYRTNNGRGPVSPYMLSRPPAADAIAEETDIAIDAAMAAAKIGDAA